MRAALVYIFTALVTVAASSQAVSSDTPETLPDSIRTVAGRTTADTVVPAITADTMPAIPEPPEKQSRIRREKVDLDNPVQAQASDSMVMIGQNMVYMYGSASVNYGEIKLDAAQIEMDLNTSTVYAVGKVDSVGDLEETPVFQNGGDTYESETMRYNFKTEKGFITNVITQQGEGYLTGGQTKKMDNDEYYIQNGQIGRASCRERV